MTEAGNRYRGGIMARLSGRQLGLELCKALNIEPDNIINIRLEAAVNDVAVVKITRAVTDAEIGMIAGKLEQYNLISK
jgi:hypothetical protein